MIDDVQQMNDVGMVVYTKLIKQSTHNSLIDVGYIIKVFII